MQFQKKLIYLISQAFLLGLFKFSGSLCYEIFSVKNGPTHAIYRQTNWKKCRMVLALTIAAELEELTSKKQYLGNVWFNKNVYILSLQKKYNRKLFKCLEESLDLLFIRRVVCDSIKRFLIEEIICGIGFFLGEWGEGFFSPRREGGPDPDSEAEGGTVPPQFNVWVVGFLGPLPSPNSGYGRDTIGKSSIV